MWASSNDKNYVNIILDSGLFSTHIIVACDSDTVRKSVMETLDSCLAMFLNPKKSWEKTKYDDTKQINPHRMKRKISKKVNLDLIKSGFECTNKNKDIKFDKTWGGNRLIYSYSSTYDYVDDVQSSLDLLQQLGNQ